MRTTRRKSAANASKAVESENEDFAPEEAEDSVEEYQPKKKARTSGGTSGAAAGKGKGKGRRKPSAKLEALGAMPFDILHEICASLDLETLFNLNRVSKVLHNFLNASTSRALWETARVNSGLPELKVPLDNLAYARLIFGNDCDLRQGCGASPRNRGLFKVDYYFRQRWCPECHDAKTTDWTAKCFLEIHTAHKDEEEALAEANYSVSDLARSSTTDHLGRAKRRHDHLLSDVNEIYAAFKAFQQARPDLADSRLIEEDDGTLTYSDADVDLPEHVEAYKYCIERRVLLLASNQDAASLRSWSIARQGEKEVAKDVIRKHRREEIELRFRALGWGDADFATHKWKSQNLLGQVKPLTDKTWITVEPVLTKVLEAQREQVQLRQRHEAQSLRRHTVVEIWRALMADEATARASGLYPLPEMAAFLQLDSVEAQWEPLDSEMTAESFEASYPVVAVELDGLRLTLKKGIFECVLEQFTLVDATRSTTTRGLPVPDSAGEYSEAQMDSLLSRPTSIVRCTACNKAGSFDMAVSHHCSPAFRSWSLGFRPSNAGGDAFDVGNYSSAGLIEIARKILDKVGLDEETATEDDVKALDHRLSCRSCPVKDLKWTCVGFYTMIKHTRLLHCFGRAPLFNVEYHATDAELLDEYKQLSTEHANLPPPDLMSDDSDDDFY
ncbi:hypothetical protein P7C70_g8560, partial [Phenoliferia sp. Uapishka_3]